MGTCILDLFPDVQQQLDLLMDQSFVTQSYPIAEFIVVFGFLLVLTMEQIVLDYKEQSLLNRFVCLISSSSDSLHLPFLILSPVSNHFLHCRLYFLTHSLWCLTLHIS